jgi:hypothetical protein
VKLISPDFAKPCYVAAEFLFPGRGVREGDEVPSPLVQLGQGRSRLGARDVTADGFENPFHTRLAVHVAINVMLKIHDFLLPEEFDHFSLAKLCARMIQEVHICADLNALKDALSATSNKYADTAGTVY